MAREAADQETSQTLYFDKFAKTHLLSALRSLIFSASQATKHSASVSDSVLPYRLIRSLMDRPEIGDSIVSDILPDLSSCLKIQVESLGGFAGEKPSVRTNAHGSKSSVKVVSASSGGKKSGKKSHKLEVLQSANLFFNYLAPEQLWQWMESLVGQAIMAGARGEGVQLREEGKGSEVEEEGKGREEGQESVRDVESLPNSPISPTSPVSLAVAPGGKKEERRERGVQLSCSSACKLIKFLLQVLPLVYLY